MDRYRSIDEKAKKFSTDDSPMGSARPKIQTRDFSVQQDPFVAEQDKILVRASMQSESSQGSGGSQSHPPHLATKLVEAIMNKVEKSQQTNLTYGPAIRRSQEFEATLRKRSLSLAKQQRRSVLHRPGNSKLSVGLSKMSSWTYPVDDGLGRSVGGVLRDVEMSVHDQDWEMMDLDEAGVNSGEYERRPSNRSSYESDHGGKRMQRSRRKIRQKDAMIMARPLGYREIKLMSTFRTFDKSTQVDAPEIEKTRALLHGTLLDKGTNIVWPTNGEFTITLAEKSIEQYIKRCWKMCSRWGYNVEFLQSHASCYANKYIFEVKWSMPTKENPIPMACASVFFVFEVDIYARPEEEVGIHYVLEGSRFPHKPGGVPFQQKWITDIICDKMRFSRIVNY